MKRILRPLEGEPLTFWHVAGDIIWLGDGRPTPIAEAQVEGLLDIYFDERAAAAKAGDEEAGKLARKLFLQLTDAKTAQDRWLYGLRLPRAA